MAMHSSPGKYWFSTLFRNATFEITADLGDAFFEAATCLGVEINFSIQRLFDCLPVFPDKKLFLHLDVGELFAGRNDYGLDLVVNVRPIFLRFFLERPGNVRRQHELEWECILPRKEGLAVPGSHHETRF